MWQYNDQIESGTGCWDEAVCSGNGAYDMFDGRKIQFFCDKRQKKIARKMSAPFGLSPASNEHFDKFEVVCTKDEDCPHPEKG